MIDHLQQEALDFQELAGDLFRAVAILDARKLVAISPNGLELVFSMVDLSDWW